MACSRSGSAATSARVRNDVARVAERQARLHALLADVEPELLQAAHRSGGERRILDVGQRRAAPEREHGVEAGRGLSGVAARQVAARALERIRGVAGVHRDGAGAELVARWPRRDDVSAQRPAQLRDVAVHGGQHRLGRLVAPHPGDEPVRGHDPPGIESEHRQDSAPPHAAQRDGPPRADRLHRSQESNVDLFAQGATVHRCAIWTHR